MKPITPDVTFAIWRNLKEFGYASLPQTYVAEQVQALIDGKNPTGIIAAFVRTMLGENGYLDDLPAEGETA